VIIDKKRKPILDSLLQDLDHPNPNINKQACLAMVKYWPAESMQKLIDNIDHKDVVFRRKVVKALSFFGKDIVLPLSKLYISRKDITTRISCLKILVYVASELPSDLFPVEGIAIIDLALRDESPEVILIVISLLRQLGSFSIPYLKAACRDENILKARAAVTAISELSDPSISDFLDDLVKDDSIDPIIKQGVLDSINIS